MTEKVTIERRENLPMPLIYLASAEDLARWQVSQLEWAYAQGQRELAISCFDTAAMGFDVAQSSYIVLKAVMTFLHDHPDVAHLKILCGDEVSWQAYRFHWNMWYAANKPEQGQLEKKI